MLLSIILLPLLGAITAGFAGNWIGRVGSMLITTSLIGTIWIFAVKMFRDCALYNAIKWYTVLPWFKSGDLYIGWDFVCDSLTVIMLSLVSTVSFCVHLYSTAYMKDDPNVPRFFSYLSLFTFFMLILVTANNFVVLFVGWEGVGLRSYLLINFWFTRLQASKAAMQAVIYNRVGDLAIIIAMILLFASLGTLDFSSIFASAPFMNETLITVVAVLLFIGAMAKSAQIGLHSWLPTAMEGPTPVSALIHAATMVTAGVFLVIRCSSLFEFAPISLAIVAIIGSTTALFAASIGLFQNDIKRVVAYSTCSQLGYMAFVAGLSNYSASLFHLFNHGFFKALLFLSAGSVIHSLSGDQDMRKMGGLLTFIPYIYVTVLVGSLALIGFPFLAGFYSKDVILETAFATYTVPGLYTYWLGSITAVLTAFYSYRALHMTFLGKNNGYRQLIEHLHSPTTVEIIVLSILAFFSIIAGYSFKDLFVGAGSQFFSGSIFVLPSRLEIEIEFIPTYIKLLPVIGGLFGSVFGYYLLYTGKMPLWTLNKLSPKLFSFLANKWYFSTVYNYFIGLTVLHAGYRIFWVWDKWLLEQLPISSGFLLYNTKENISKCKKALSILVFGKVYTGEEPAPLVNYNLAVDNKPGLKTHYIGRSVYILINSIRMLPLLFPTRGGFVPHYLIVLFFWLIILLMLGLSSWSILWSTLPDESYFSL